MKRFLSIACMLLLAVLLAGPAKTQTTGTQLVLSAHWDDNSAVAGNVNLALVGPSGQQTVLATKVLSSYGRTNFATNLAANALYKVTLSNTSGVQMVQFPLTTALINPQNLQEGEVDLVFRKADGSMKSAKVSVEMGF